jgi:hypothetical protein
LFVTTSIAPLTQHEVDVDDPIARHLDIPSGAHVLADTSIRQLLNHTDGIGYRQIDSIPELRSVRLIEIENRTTAARRLSVVELVPTTGERDECGDRVWHETCFRHALALRMSILLDAFSCDERARFAIEHRIVNDRRRAPRCDRFEAHINCRRGRVDFVPQRARHRIENRRGTCDPRIAKECVVLRDETIDGSSHWSVGRDDHAVRCDHVHRTLKRIAKARAALDAQELAALRDAQQLRLWRRYGHTSLLDYMERELGYTPRAALERLRVADAVQELPQIGEALAQGDLSFSAARELSRVATGETESEWLQAATDKNMRQVEDMISGHKKGDRPTDPADPSLRTKVLRFEVSPETFALARQVQRVLEQERGERLDDDTVMAAIYREILDARASAATPSARTRAAYSIAVTICEQCQRGWQDGGGVTVEMSPPAIERAQCDAERIGSVDGDETARAKQEIPPTTRRKVLRRDRERCRVPGCRSRNLDIHHIKPRAEGGTHEASGLVTLCEAHHLALHAGSLSISGTAPDLVFTRHPPSAYKNATLAVETAKALHGLGFKKHEIKEAMDKARTHVGSADVTIQQWITIALGYCPRPTS